MHEEYATNINLALQGYWVYDFALPLLILHAFTFKTMDNLKHWLEICPRRQITVLDTHDGMGIDDIAGLAEVTFLLSIDHPKSLSACIAPSRSARIHLQDPGQSSSTG